MKSDFSFPSFYSRYWLLSQVFQSRGRQFYLYLHSSGPGCSGSDSSWVPRWYVARTCPVEPRNPIPPMAPSSSFKTHQWSFSLQTGRIALLTGHCCMFLFSVSLLSSVLIGRHSVLFYQSPSVRFSGRLLFPCYLVLGR